MINQIATKFQEILGFNYRVLVNHNAGDFLDIKANATVDDQLLLSTNKTDCLLRSDTGSYVALKDIRTTSFSFSMEFFVEVGKDIDTEIEAFIDEVNGQVLTVDSYNFVGTFNQPFMSQAPRITNGNHFYVLNLSGNIAITDQSLFGNELTVKLDNEPIEGLLSVNPSMDAVVNPYSIENSIVPSLERDYINSNMSLVIHARKDATVTNTILEYVIDVATQLNKETFSLEISYNSVVTTYDAVLSNASVEASLGGYVILSANFVRTVIIDE